MDIGERFDQFEDDHLEFDRIEQKLHKRPDLHAFLLLDSLFPGDSDMVSGASHDEIYLAVDAEELNKVATDEQIRDLIRCGVFYSSGTDSLMMFV